MECAHDSTRIGLGRRRALRSTHGTSAAGGLLGRSQPWVRRARSLAGSGRPAGSPASPSRAPATAPPHDADRRACRACRTGPWRAAARHAFCRERSNAGAAAGRGASFGLPRAAGAGPIRGVPGGDRGSPVLFRAWHRPAGHRAGDRGGRHRPGRPGRRDSRPATGQAAVHRRDVGLAVKLYLSYSHPQILQMYADVAYFGHGYYGLSAASCGYFGTPSAGLSWPEAAMLAGLVQGPSTDDPILHFARARAREQHVLGRLVATGTLTQAQADTAYSQQLHLVGGTGAGCSATP